MNWGKGIILAFVLFAAFMGVVVYKAMNEDISLVSKTYYEDELAYQNIIQAKENYQKLSIKPSYEINDGILKLNFNQKIDSAAISIYRPSDVSKDFKIKSTESAVEINFEDKPRGMWLLKATFLINNVSYYTEYTLTI